MQNNFRPEYREYFDLYANPTYINVTVSSTHGAAVEFFPSNESIFDFRTTEQRIESAVFPDVDLNITSIDVDATVFVWQGKPSHPMIIFNGTGSGFIDIIFITNKGHLLDLGIGGSLFFFSVNVDGRYYYILLIKGSNTPNAWTSYSAKEEAKKQAKTFFEHDVFRAFNQSEEIREYMVYPILEELIRQIVWKHQHADDIGYDMLQYKEDLARVRDLAVNTYHLNSSFVDEILAWLEDIYPEPPPEPLWEKAPYSWILAAIIGGLVTFVLARLTKRALKMLKRKWR